MVTKPQSSTVYDQDADVEAIRQAANPTPGDLPVVMDDEETGEGKVNDDEFILPSYEEALEGSAAVAGSLIDKSELVGRPFVIYDFDFQPGKIVLEGGELMTHFDGVDRNVREFVICRIVTAPATGKPSEYLVFTDGSTGVYAALRKLADRHGIRRVRCARGLRVSRYAGPQGGESETYYLT